MRGITILDRENQVGIWLHEFLKLSWNNTCDIIKRINWYFTIINILGFTYKYNVIYFIFWNESCANVIKHMY